MAQAQYVGVDGIARKVNKEYVGVDGVAREVTKGYVGVDGVAREYWGREEEEVKVAWAKYDCYAFYVEDRPVNNASASVSLPYTLTLYPSYTFSKANGYQPVGESTTITITRDSDISEVNSIIVDKCTLHNNPPWSQCQRYGEIKSLNDPIGMSITISFLKARLNYFQETFQGVFIRPLGTLPEEGNLIDGSLDGDHCVLEIDGTYYYYKRTTITYWEKYNGSRSEIRNYSQLSYSDTEEVSFSKNYEYSYDYSSYAINYGLSFSAEDGYYRTNETYQKVNPESTLSDLRIMLEGSYPWVSGYNFDTDPFQIVSITSIQHNGTYVTINGTRKRVGKATYSVTGYEYIKSGNAVGYIQTAEGELPESGTLVDGSATGEYCVLSGVPNSTRDYFYYLKTDAPAVPIVTWYKYSCSATGYFTEGEPDTYIGNESFAYDMGDGIHTGVQYLETGYYFSSSSGYQLTGRTARYVSEPTIAALNASHVGYYGGGTTNYNSEVRLFKNVISAEPEGNGYGLMRVEKEVRTATFHPESFTPGLELLDTKQVLQGEKPENYELIEGSLNGPYCILWYSGGGRYYYYTTTQL